MEAKIDIALIPFRVPNYVIVEEPPAKRQEGFKEVRKFKLSELDCKTLHQLCDDFRAEVLKKAGKI